MRLRQFLILHHSQEVKNSPGHWELSNVQLVYSDDPVFHSERSDLILVILLMKNSLKLSANSWFVNPEGSDGSLPLPSRPYLEHLFGVSPMFHEKYHNSIPSQSKKANLRLAYV